MNKEEFLTKLRKKLDVLEDKEIEDIISEYEGYIEEKKSRGLTEEEAIKELGDLNEISSDLLGAYKVKQKGSNYLNKFIDKVSQIFDKVLNELSTKSGKDILKFVVEICLIILLICIFKIPFIFIKDLGWNIFSTLSYPISNTFYSIWSFIIELSYFILAIILFIKIIQKRYFEGISEKIVADLEEQDVKKNKKKIKKETIEASQTKEIREVTPKKHSIIDMVINICILFLKVIVTMCLFGVICYLIGMAFLIVIGIYLLIKGITYFGIFILFIALFLGGVLLLQLGTYFIFNKKVKGGHILAELITIILLTGIGLSISTIEIANTEIIYNSPYEKTKTTTKELSISEDLALYGNYNIIIDNTLTDTIKIEYTYPDINNVEVDIDLSYYDNGYYLDYNIRNLSWNKNFFDEFIENLKDKKIYINPFEIEKNVYMSLNTQELLFKNKEINSNDNDIIYEFTRTYNILKVEESNDYAYLYLVVRQYQFEEIATVKVLRSMADTIEEGKNYEFTFRYNYPSTKIENDTIEELFLKCQLVSINATDKAGLEQTEEPDEP